MSTRSYVSPKRQAKAEATRNAILMAFRDQLLDPGFDQLSPTDAATRAGCSVRTVHGYFPTNESRIEAMAELLEGDLLTDSVGLPTRPADLPDHFRQIHRAAASTPLVVALLKHGGDDWLEIRARRRAARLDAVRDVVVSTGADEQATHRATSLLLALAGAEITLALRDQFGVDPHDIPDMVAHNVELIVADLVAHADGPSA